jgi:hypothetical protein
MPENVPVQVSNMTGFDANVFDCRNQNNPLIRASNLRHSGSHSNTHFRSGAVAIRKHYVQRLPLFTVLHNLSTKILSKALPRPSILILMPLSFSIQVNFSLVNWLP